MDWPDNSESKNKFNKEFSHAWYGSEVESSGEFVKIPTRKYSEWLEAEVKRLREVLETARIFISEVSGHWSGCDPQQIGGDCECGYKQTYRAIVEELCGTHPSEVKNGQ